MLYFKQLLAGRDFATRDAMAAQMRNFSYLIGDREARQCVVVDPAWDVASLVEIAEGDGMKVVGAMVSHYHPDHIGGDLFGHQVEGIVELRELRDMAVHCQSAEARWVEGMTGMPASELTRHDGDSTLEIGKVRIDILHTPGHSQGSQCFHVAGGVVTGDVLFVGACGRVDLPGADPREMYHTLHDRLGRLPGETVLYPGHDYGATPTSTLEAERRANFSLQPRPIDEWLGIMTG